MADGVLVAQSTQLHVYHTEEFKLRYILEQSGISGQTGCDFRAVFGYERRSSNPRYVRLCMVLGVQLVPEWRWTIRTC